MIGLSYDYIEGLSDLIEDRMWDLIPRNLEQIVEQYESKIVEILQGKGYLVMGPATEAGDD